MASRYRIGSNGDWSDTAHWSASSGGAGGASVPTSADDATFDNSSGVSGTITLTANAQCKTFIAVGPNFALDCQGLYTVTVAGDLRPFRVSVLNAPAFAFVVTANSAVNQFGTGDPKGIRITGGTATLGSALSTTGTISVEGSAALDTAGNAVTVAAFATTGAGPDVALGASLVTITGAGIAWDFASGTLSAGTSTIKFTNISAAARTFNGGGKTYNDVWFSGAYTGILDINGSNTFNDFKSDAGLHTIRFAAGSTQTVSTFTLGGTGGSTKTTLRSQSDGSPWNLVKASGSVVCDWLDLKDSHASGGASFTATNSLDSGGNSGWTITPPPVLPFAGGPARRTYIRR